MPDLFIDTSGWAEIIDTTQPQHSLAARLYHSARQNGRKLVTTSYVVTELVALLTTPFRLSRPQLIMLVGRVRASKQVEIIHVDPELDEQAWQLLTKRQDKDWSLVDCLSLVVMQQRVMTEALTSDHHFEQMGFIKLLK